MNEIDKGKRKNTTEEKPKSIEVLMTYWREKFH